MWSRAADTVRGRTWYFRRLLKRTIEGVIVGCVEPRRGLVWKRGVLVGDHLPVVPGTPGNSDRARAAKLELLLAGLVAQQASGSVGYWAAFTDERGVSHFAFTTDPTYADLSPENAANRTRAAVALGRAIERQRAMQEPARAWLRDR